MTGATAVTAELLREMPLPQPSETGDKDERGRVLVVAGSPEVPGGALLAGVAALRAGAGKLQIATAASIAPHLGLAVPEALVIALPESADGGVGEGALEAVLPRARRCDALVIGPGILDEAGAAALAGGLLAALDGPAFVLDAGALIRLGDLGEPMRKQGGRVVVTPHAGEMAGLLGIAREDVVSDPLGTARRAAAMLQSVVILKGPVTSIVVPQGGAWSFSQGSVGLATSGSGDTLAGIVGGLLARGGLAPARGALGRLPPRGGRQPARPRPGPPRLPRPRAPRRDPRHHAGPETLKWGSSAAHRHLPGRPPWGRKTGKIATIPASARGEPATIPGRFRENGRYRNMSARIGDAAFPALDQRSTRRRAALSTISSDEGFSTQGTPSSSGACSSKASAPE
jgi:hydroxyethylthiazole kinase-like uncharacterized protein yjeF